MNKKIIFFLIVLIIIFIGGIIYVLTNNSDDSAAKEKYCQHVSDYSSAVDSWINDDSIEPGVIPQSIFDQKEATKYLVDNSSVPIQDEWRTVDSYLELIIQAYDIDFSMNEELKDLTQQAFVSQMVIARSIQEECGITLSGTSFGT